MQVNMRGAISRIARLLRLTPPEDRKLGLLKGQIWMAPDFDETSEDIIRAFEGAFEGE